jgi:hypothetical protein
MNRKQRIKNAETAEKLRRSLPPKNRCPNCKELTHDGHYVPPNFGDEGFYICEKANEKRS